MNKKSTDQDPVDKSVRSLSKKRKSATLLAVVALFVILGVFIYWRVSEQRSFKAQIATCQKINKAAVRNIESVHSKDEARKFIHRYEENSVCIQNPSLDEFKTMEFKEKEAILQSNYILASAYEIIEQTDKAKNIATRTLEYIDRGLTQTERQKVDAGDNITYRMLFIRG